MDTKFAVLVPMHLKEAWVELRDYPLPLAHILSTDKHHGNNLYSFFLEENLVVGEELRGMIKGDDSKYIIIVPRTVSLVKLYSDLM